MTRINLDTDWIDEKEKTLRRIHRMMQPPPSSNKDPTIYTYTNALFSFNLRKPSWDSKGAIEGQLVEDDMRLKFLYPFIKKGYVFYDVGACHGSWTFPALALGATVYAFEPDPRFHDSLKNSCAVNPGFESRLHLYAVALAHKEITGQLLELDEVPFKTLDNCVKEIGRAPDFVKIDVEGLEKHVLKGARETIALHRPRIFVENHLGDEVEEEMKNFLGYKLERGRKEKAFSYLFFEPKG